MTTITGPSARTPALLSAKERDRADYRQAARRANAYVRRTINLDALPNCRGGVKGPVPVSGVYGQYQYLNWAAKFTLDAQRMELQLNSVLG